MIDSIPIKQTEKENKTKIEYMNAFGVVFNNYLVIYNINQKTTIEIADIKWISLRKKRKPTKNVYLLSLAILTSIITYFIHFSTTNMYIFSTIIAFALFISVIFFKEYKYKFTIIKHNDLLEFEVKRSLKDDAKKIQKFLNDKLKRQ
jgi:hypothetical protein